MSIQNHRLSGVLWKPSPNVGGEIILKGILLHFTAGRSARGAVSTFLNPENDKSAHLVIGDDGEVTQMVAFNRQAWHAGASSWGALVKMNRYLIGIEFVNPGFLKRVNGVWTSPHLKTAYPDSEVIEAKHKHGGRLLGWKKFPEVQIQAGLKAVQEILQTYPEAKLILGHDDVAPGRKRDPGPAFPMARFQALATS